MTDLADALLALLVLVAGTLAPIGLAALIGHYLPAPEDR